MRKEIIFKEWLPDQPALGNPGMIEATNVLPSASGYIPFLPLDASGATLASTAAGVNGAFVVNHIFSGEGTSTVAAKAVYVNNGTIFYEGATKSAITADSAVFAQYEEILIAAVYHKHSATLVTYSDALSAVVGVGGSVTTLNSLGVGAWRTVGIVGQFAVLGHNMSNIIGSDVPNRVFWSAIDDPTNFPTPGSDTAIATQSGQQDLKVSGGAVMAIHGGDQFGVILQRKAVTRMTYIGGVAVFQFDTVDETYGLRHKFGSIKVGGDVYFISPNGFCRTNGVVVERIGDGKVDKQWISDYASATDDVSCAYDQVNDLVCWGMGNKIYFYHPATNQWSVCNQNHSFILSPAADYPMPNKLIGWDGNGVRGLFAGSAGSAVITTGEVEMKPGGFSRISGFKPIVSGSTAVSMTVAIGTRNSEDTAASFTSETSANSRTGFADFRSEARYHRARVTITGSFTKAIGGEFDALPSGDT